MVIFEILGLLIVIQHMLFATTQWAKLLWGVVGAGILGLTIVF